MAYKQASQQFNDIDRLLGFWSEASATSRAVVGLISWWSIKNEQHRKQAVSLWNMSHIPF